MLFFLRKKKLVVADNQKNAFICYIFLFIFRFVGLYFSLQLLIQIGGFPNPNHPLLIALIKSEMCQSW